MHRVSLAACLLLSACCLYCAHGKDKKAIIKVGGVLQSTGHGANAKKVFELWKKWAASADNKLGFEVDLKWEDFTKEKATEAAKKLTDKTVCKEDCVDVFVCPYGSAGTLAAIKGIPEKSTIPILIWGAAASQIFDEACKDRKCFGTLTKASEYFGGGLSGLKDAAASSKPLSVGLIMKKDPFAEDVARGAKEYMEEDKGFTIVEEASSFEGAIEEKPDLVLVANNNGKEVAEGVLLIGKSTYRPKAILAVNSITNKSITSFQEAKALQFQECLLMPSQWAAKPGMKDDIVGWTPETFTRDLDIGFVTYQAASAAGSAIAVTHALQKWSPEHPEHLWKALKHVDITTLFGKIKYSEDGSISKEKPVYTRQKQEMSNPIVFPEDAKTADLKFPLTTCDTWKLKTEKLRLI